MMHDIPRAGARALRYLVLAGVAMLGAACGDELTAADAGETRARFVNAAPGTPNVVVRWADVEAFTEVAYGTVAAEGQYKVLPAGTQSLVVHAPGATSSLTAGAITTAGDRRYTLAFVRSGPAYTIAVLRDTAAAPAAGKAKVRVAHLAQLAEGSVDVYVTVAGADIAAATPTSAGVQRLRASNYVELDAGTYQVRVTTAGTKTVILDSGALELAAGSVRTLLAMDHGGDAFPLNLLVLSDN